MKKTALLLLALALLLTGCRQKEPEVSSQPSTEVTQSTEAAPAPTEPGRYQADSGLEAGTGGAVRLFAAADLAASGILPTGEGVLLFSQGKLTLLSGEDLGEEVSVQVPEDVCLEDPYFVWGENGFAYYDAGKNVYVLLDSRLQQTDTLEVPADALNVPVLSGDLRTMYYATETAIRAMDLASGASRLLRQGSAALRQVEGLLFDGQGLLYSQDGSYYLISTENGQTLFDGDHRPHVETGERMYFQVEQDYITELTLGTWDGDSQSFHPAEGMEDLAVDLQAMAAVSRSGQWLYWYDLSLGLRSAQLELPGDTAVRSLTVDAQGKVWFLDGNGDLACWDASRSQVKVPETCLGPVYTRNDPDTGALEALAAQAQAMGETYGVEILLDLSGTEYQSYTFTSEYRAAALEKGLQVLEGVLRQLPEGLLDRLGDVAIGLAAQIQGPTAAGVQFWRSGQPVLVAALSEDLELELYRQIYMVMDSWILTESKLLDDWDSLNPYGVDYDYDYAANEKREDLTGLEGDDPAFLDRLSMSYPKEDRATVFAYAMTKQGEGRFESEVLRQKLTLLCQAVRKGLDLEEESYPWEQYLA